MSQVNLAEQLDGLPDFVDDRPINQHQLVELLEAARMDVEGDPLRAAHWLDRIISLFPRAIEPEVEQRLFPQFPKVRQAGGVAHGGLAAWQINRVVNHIEVHLAETVLVDELAGICRLSSGHFCRAFKVSVGETPHVFIVRQRLRQAQRLMLTTPDGLSQIAQAVGLTDQAHLSRLFRKLIGVTPLNWRKACQPA